MCLFWRKDALKTNRGIVSCLKNKKGSLILLFTHYNSVLTGLNFSIIFPRPSLRFDLGYEIAPLQGQLQNSKKTEFWEIFLMKAKNVKTVNSSPLPFYIFCLHEKKIQKAVFSNSAIVPYGTKERIRLRELLPRVLLKRQFVMRKFGSYFSILT